MSKFVNCIFCGKKRTRAKEHVFAEWLLKHLDIAGDRMGGHHISTFGITLFSRIQSAGSISLGHICMECNNGWMCALEKEAAVCLKPVLPQPSDKASWKYEECKIVAIWAFKTAVVLNESSIYRSIVPAYHFRSLFKGLRIPDGVVVDIGLDCEAKHLRWRQSQQWIGLFPLHEKKRIASVQSRSYKISFGIGSMVLCIAFWPLLDYKLLRDSNNFRRLWPNPKTIDFSIQPTLGGIDEFEAGLYFRRADFV